MPSAQKGVGDGIRAGDYPFLAPNAMTINRLGSQYYGCKRALSLIGTSTMRPVQEMSTMNFTTLLNFLFGCHHVNLSRVFTIRRRTYRVCCDCGAEFDYSIEKMAVNQRHGQRSELHVVEDMRHSAA